MKTILGIAFGVFALTIALSSESSAQGRFKSKSINAREHNQAQRIRQGMQSGELTARETGRLAAEQVRIHRQEERFRESGEGFSVRERERLQRELNESSRQIYRQKHDGQDYPDIRRP